ncbi:MAG TPA: AAA family ATPase [Mycobacteriales bacterium]|nr:AAA family ATPase [Mycobacteriales bacterium]
MGTCTQCGQDNVATARFCNGCGAPLVELDATGARKTVTIVFCDLVGSTALGERSDPEVLRELMRRYHAELRVILERHGGTVEKFVGDAAMAVFGIPQVHEDDALRAVRAALSMRSAVEPLGLQVRIGVNTGEVVAGHGETLVTGDAVNVAARLEQAAPVGEVLIGETTAQLVRDAVRLDPVEPLALKGKAEPVPAFRVVELRTDPVASQRLSPFVGREDELELLEHAFRTAVDKRVPQLATIVGPPGIGKSRITRELLARCGARVLAGRCLPYGDAITYWPLTEIVAAVGDLDAALAGSDDADLVIPRLAAALGRPGAAASADEIAWGFRRLLERVAAEAPLVVVVDDIHWAEPALLDLIDYVATFTQDAPLLVLCATRPELFELRPEWATPRVNSLVLKLEPLAESQTASLASGLGDLDEPTRLRIVEAADGNPLFVEQLIAMHQESGGSELEIPPTLQALLAARIDRLDQAERAVVERGAIEGRLFHRGAVAGLLPEQDRRDVGPRLLSLVRRELIRPDRAVIAGDDAFRFGHMLVRDAAYQSIPKRHRAQLHRRFGEWLVDRLGDAAPAEIVGHHFEQAHRYVVELGDSDDALAELAAEHLIRAGRAAQSRLDVGAAVKMFDRAVVLLVRPSAQRLEALLVLAGLLHETGALERAAEVAALAEAEARAAGDERAVTRARIEAAFVPMASAPEGATDVALEIAESAIAAADPDDHVTLARAWALAAAAHNMHAAESSLMQALLHVREHARACGNREQELDAVRLTGGPIVFGPLSVDAGRRLVAEVLDEMGDVAEIQIWALHVTGHLRARRGEFDGAAADLAAWRAHLRELGREMHYASTAMCMWDVLSLSEDYASAETALLEAVGILERLGEVGVRSSALALLGDVAFRQGRLDEAEQRTLDSERLGARDDYFNESIWRSVRAQVWSARGRHAEAVALAREAATVVDRTEMTDQRADIRLALARVLFAAGEDVAGAQAARDSAEIYAQKGNLVGARRARDLLASTASS